MGPSHVMGTVAGLFSIASLLLVVGGVPKLRDPAPTGRALSAVGLAGSAGAVRAIGLFEITLGTGAVLVGGTALAMAVAATYGALAGFLAYALANPERARGCGCFGESEASPSYLHFAGDVVACGVALVAAVLAVPGISTTLADQPAAAVPYLALVGMGTWFSYLVLTLVPGIGREAQV